MNVRKRGTRERWAPIEGGEKREEERLRSCRERGFERTEYLPQGRPQPGHADWLSRRPAVYVITGIP